MYAEWSERGAQFPNAAKQHETEIRCYIRDPDGYLIEVVRRLCSAVGIHRLDHLCGRAVWDGLRVAVADPTVC